MAFVFIATRGLHCTRWAQQDGQPLWAAQGGLPSTLATFRTSGSEAAWLTSRTTIQYFQMPQSWTTSQHVANIAELRAPHNSVGETQNPGETSALPTAHRRCCSPFPLSSAGILQPYAQHKGFSLADPCCGTQQVHPSASSF